MLLTVENVLNVTVSVIWNIWPCGTLRIRAEFRDRQYVTVSVICKARNLSIVSVCIASCLSAYRHAGPLVTLWMIVTLAWLCGGSQACHGAIHVPRLKPMPQRNYGRGCSFMCNHSSYQNESGTHPLCPLPLSQTHCNPTRSRCARATRSRI